MFAIIASIAFGLVSALTKILVDLSIDANTILLSRCIIIVSVIGVYLIASKKMERLTLKNFRDLLFFGVVGYGGAIYLLAMAYVYIPMGQATMIHFTYPFFVALFMIIFYKEKITREKGIALILTCIGVLLLTEFNITFSWIGIIFALLSGAAYGLYMISVSQSSLKELNPANLLFYLALLITVLFGIYGILKGTDIPNFSNIAMVLPMMGVAACSIVGILFTTIAVRIIGPTYTSMICVLEPVIAVLCSVILFHEDWTGYTFSGSVLLVIVILLITNDNKKGGK